MNKKFILLPHKKRIVRLDKYDEFMLTDHSIIAYREGEEVDRIYYEDDEDTTAAESIFKDIAENICINGYAAREI